MIEDGVAEVGEAIQDVEEFFYVVEVQAGGGLVQDVEGAAGLALRKFFREFDALGFAAGKRGGGLAELDVAEADVHQRFELLRGSAEYFPEFSARRRSACPAGRKSSGLCSARKAFRRCSGGRGRLRR